MIYIILGMHKSGTTLISKTLHKSGINMGDFNDNVSYDKGNQYEREEVLNLDISILNAEKIPSYLVNNNNLSVSTKDKEKATKIINKCDITFDDWGIKEPRMPLLLDFWSKILKPYKYKTIIVIRDPRELLVHYKVKNPFILVKVIKSWRATYLNIIKYVPNMGNGFITINYNDFMTENYEFLNLKKFVNNDIVDLRDKKLYRSKVSSLNRLTKVLYDLFYKKSCERLIYQLSNLK